MRYAEVYLHRNMVPAGGLAGRAVVVFDVLRASTSAAAALAAGAECLAPFRDLESMQAYREGLEPELAARCLLAGERGGLAAPGFDLGNSPGEFTPEAVGGRVLLFSTTNGTEALARAAEADPVYFAALVNLGALVEILSGRFRRKEEGLALICAGTELSASLEDMLAAGLLLERLEVGSGGWELDDGALAVLAVAAKWRGRESQAMRLAVGGRNVSRLGLDADIEAAARLDSVTVVPQLVTEDGPLPGLDVLVKAPRPAPAR